MTGVADHATNVASLLQLMSLKAAGKEPFCPGAAVPQGILMLKAALNWEHQREAGLQGVC